MSKGIQHPVDASGVTAAYVNSLLEISGHAPSVAAVKIESALTYGEQMVSTSRRILFSVVYKENCGLGLPTRLMLKVARTDDDVMAPFYANEVAFYTNVRPDLAVEIPKSLGGHFDPNSRLLALLLEDLREKGARFPNVQESVPLERVRDLLRTLSRVHGHLWNRHGIDKRHAFLGNALEGDVAFLLNDGAAPYIQHEIDNQKFKNELVGMLGWTGDELRAGTKAMHRHQLQLDQCLVHGDAHLGNTYFLPDGSCGLLDWQLTGFGHPMHDVSYIVSTALSVAERRIHEEDLLRAYLDDLGSAGVNSPPSFEAAWTEYRRSMIWNVYVGWLTTPVINYGWEINVINHLRLVTAFQDLETGKLVRDVM